jgi:hypothetical protein
MQVFVYKQFLTNTLPIGIEWYVDSIQHKLEKYHFRHTFQSKESKFPGASTIPHAFLRNKFKKNDRDCQQIWQASIHLSISKCEMNFWAFFDLVGQNN